MPRALISRSGLTINERRRTVSVQFGEVPKRSALDVNAKPFPAMIAPLSGSNIIEVFGASGLSLFGDCKVLKIKELHSNVVILDKLIVYSLAMGMRMGNPGSAAAIQLKLAVEVGLQLAGNPRFSKSPVERQGRSSLVSY